MVRRTEYCVVRRGVWENSGPHTCAALLKITQKNILAFWFCKSLQVSKLCISVKFYASHCNASLAHLEKLSQFWIRRNRMVPRREVDVGPAPNAVLDFLISLK